jgi:RNase H-fold protein (predicted Holliday junction resolvase)
MTAAPHPRTLAFDVGDRRIGIAITDISASQSRRSSSRSRCIRNEVALTYNSLGR